MKQHGRVHAAAGPVVARRGSRGRAAAAAASDGSGGASPQRLLDLPADLIGQIFALAGRRQAAAAAATCRQLWSAYWAAAPMWQDIRINVSPSVACLSSPQLFAAFAAQRRWLQRVAPMVRRAAFVGCEPAEGGGTPTAAQLERVGLHVGDLLHALEGAPLERLLVVAWGVNFEFDDAVALRRCGSSLEMLGVGPPNPAGPGGRCRLSAGAAGSLRGMRQLKTLKLSVESLPGAVLDAICELPALQSLFLYSSSPLPPGLPRLSALPALLELVLHEAFSSAAGMALPEPEFMERLIKLELTGRRIQVPPSGGHSTMRGCDTPGGTTMCSLEMWECTCCENRTLVLQDVCLEHSAGLLSLLRAGGAAGGTLETLNFERCHLSAACFARPAGDEGEAQEDALASLSFLKVSECYGEGWDTEGVEAELLELLGQAGELECLAVQDCALAANALPELLEGEALASLELEECGLDHFPPFEGMEELEALSLAGNRLQSLPASLAAATSLTALDLSSNPQLALKKADVEGVLCTLPSLRRLKLWGTATPPRVLQLLRARLPGLEVVSVRPASPEDGGGDALGVEQGGEEGPEPMEVSSESESESEGDSATTPP